MLTAVSSLPSASPAPELRRQRRAVVVLLTLALTLALLLAHAHWARTQRAARGYDSPSLRALPSTSLVLSTRSRWLRHPLLSEPGAAFQDGPAFLDADPAGALSSPPRALLRESEAP